MSFCLPFPNHILDTLQLSIIFVLLIRIFVVMTMLLLLRPKQSVISGSKIGQ